MSRIIKFRIWNNAFKKMEYNPSIRIKPNSIDGKLIIWLNNWLNEPTPDCENQDNYQKAVVEQFTGLTDKNGKEIYEGDIIESTWNGDKAEVVWNDVEGEWEHYADFNTHSKYSGSVVIGNIHENPELLDKNDKV